MTHSVQDETHRIDCQCGESFTGITSREVSEAFKTHRDGDPEALFNKFIRDWVSPNMQAHLLDSDDNDGERVRQAIRNSREEH